MGFRINTNIAAMNAWRNASQNNVGLDKSLTALSSGLRINKAADDASGLAIANQLSAQSSGLGQAIRNSNDGIAMIQTADGALEETGNILKRIRTLSVQSANDTQTDASRGYIQEEVTALTEQLNDIAGRTSFNGQNLLDGSGGSSQTVATGVSGVAGVTAVTGVTAVNEVDTFTAAAMVTNDTVIIDGLTFTATASVTQANMAAAVRGGVSVTGVTVTGAPSGDYVVSGSGNDAIFTAKTDGPIATLNNTGNKAPGALTDTTDGVTGVIAVTGVTAVADTYVGATASFKFQSGAYSSENTTVTIGSASAKALKVSGLNVSTAVGAELSIKAVDAGIVAVDTLRSTLGAAQNKLESNVRNISVTQVNVAAAESNIRDVDFAAESANFAKRNILAQSGSYAMSQANAVQQNVMRLLQ